MNEEKMLKVIFMDVDGVLTDGKINVDISGKELFKSFSSQDSTGIFKAREEFGIYVVWISAKESQITLKRAESLKIDEVHFSIDKKAKVDDFLRRYSIDEKESAFIGDDDLDIPAMKLVGCPIAVQNAVDDVKKIALYVTSRNGGDGAVREAIEYLINRQAKLFINNCKRSYK